MVLTSARSLQDSLDKDLKAVKEKDLEATLLDSELFSHMHKSEGNRRETTKAIGSINTELSTIFWGTR